MESTKKVNPNTDEPKKSVSWRAIFAGTLTVLSILLILNLIGLAFGMGTIEPTEETNPLSGIGTGALIWWVVSNLIALFAGGFIAARVGVSLTDIDGVVQGIMTWAPVYASLCMVINFGGRYHYIRCWKCVRRCDFHNGGSCRRCICTGDRKAG